MTLQQPANEASGKDIQGGGLSATLDSQQEEGMGGLRSVGPAKII